jgi:hypothetical protein
MQSVVHTEQCVVEKSVSENTPHLLDDQSYLNKLENLEHQLD